MHENMLLPEGRFVPLEGHESFLVRAGDQWPTLSPDLHIRTDYPWVCCWRLGILIDAEDKAEASIIFRDILL